MFYPFKRDNLRVPLSELEEDDISTFLASGHHESIFFEFKETFDHNVRQKLSAIVSSFANERGGWLLIGVRDHDKHLLGVDNSDFDQVIGNIVKTKITPIVYYEIKTVSLKESGKTVVVVMVPEGVDGPYIVDGTIFRRIGSNSIGTQKIKDRYDYDSIANKSKDKKDIYKNFCHPDVTVHDRQWVSDMFGKGYYTYCGVLSIYYILPDVQVDDFLILENGETRSKISNTLNSTVEPKNFPAKVSLNIPYPRYSYAHNSLVFRNNDQVELNARTIIYQFFRNGWSRVHFPIPYLDKQSLTGHSSYQKIKDIDNKIIDGQSFLKGVFSVLCLLEHMRCTLFPNYQRYILDLKVKNVKSNLFFINGSECFETYFNNALLPVVETSKFRFNKGMNVYEDELDCNNVLMVIMRLMMAFNLPPEESIQMFLETCSLSR